MEKNPLENDLMPGMYRAKSYFQSQHEKLLGSSWHIVHVMEEEKKESSWMIAGILPDLLKLLHNHCMLEEDFMILARYPDYFRHQKEHALLLHNWNKCCRKDLSRQEKFLLIGECTERLSRHIASSDMFLRKYAEKFHFPDEISLLRMYGIRFPSSSLFPEKRR